MAERAKTVTPLRTFGDNCWTVEWSGLLLGDDGNPFEGSGAADRSAQVTGTFGGATLRIAGSNDGVNYSVLTDPQGNALDITATKIESVTELTRHIKPIVVGGDGTTDLVVTLLARRP